MLSKGRERLALVLILNIGFLSRLPFLMSPAFLSDEAAYVYAAYAIGRGLIPYEQILLPHPPLGYIVITSLEFFSKGDLYILRLSYTLLLYVLALLSYWFFRILPTSSSLPFRPLIAVAIFVFYPNPYSITTPLEFIIFDIPVLLGVIFLVIGLVDGSLRRLVLAGVFLGIGMMVWYPAILVAFSLLGFLVFHELRTSEKPVTPRILKRAGAITFGGGMSVLAVVTVVTVWGDLGNFFLQSVSLQSSLRAGFTLGQRFLHIGFAVKEFLPILLLALVGGIELAWRAKRAGNPLVALPVWIFASNLVLLSTVPRVVLNHYFAYLTPFLAYAAAGPIGRLLKAFLPIRQIRLRSPPSDFFQSVLAISMIFLVGLSSLYAVTYEFRLYENPYTEAERRVGLYVSSLTLPNESIWTSEGGIAYFARRLIQPPESPRWPFQVIYNDIFNTSYVDFDGLEKEGLGVVSPFEFITAWEKHRTRVLVLIIGKGPVPYPDEFLWFGFPGTQGVESWVKQNYYFVNSFGFQGINYTYHVWLRKP